MSIYLDPAILSFYISFIGIVSMLGSKAFEIRSGKRLFFSKLSSKTDSYLRTLFYFFKRILSYINKRNAIAFIQWIAYHILLWIRSIYIWIHKKAHSHPHSKRVIDMVRGRVDIKRNGGVSFFLKRIGEENDGVGE